MENKKPHIMQLFPFGYSLWCYLADTSRHLVSIIPVISQNLLDVNHLRAGVPGDSASHQIPVSAFFNGNFLQARESGDGHNYGPSVLKIHLELPSLRKSYRLNFRGYSPVSFVCHFLRTLMILTFSPFLKVPHCFSNCSL